MFLAASLRKLMSFIRFKSPLSMSRMKQNFSHFLILNLIHEIINYILVASIFFTFIRQGAVKGE